MHGLAQCFRRARSILVAGLLITIAGCPQPTDGTTNSSTQFLDQDGNFTFSAATALPLSDTNQLTFDGEITGEGDLDLYSLGNLSPGDQVNIDVRALTGNLDAIAALFDNREFLEGYSDDRADDGSDLNPLIDVTIRGPAGEYFLGVNGFPGANTTGRYRVTVQLTRGGSVPAPSNQLVFLDWKGGQNIVVQNVGVFDLQPFSAADVGLAASQTQQLKARVQQIVQQRYADYNLVVQNSDDNPTPTTPHSTVYFGGTNPRAFAISEHIDSENKDQSDNTIVFSSSFDGAFSVTPTLEQMATAIGNTTAHEIGHLLGLLHTNDAKDLMDTRGGNDSILVDQEFKTAVLDDSTFPVGFQDSPEILGWLLGMAGM
ncbi:MAG: matrixin family metalloprotease [Phycisphaerae bacterium]